jgi:hypothetical protein
VSAQCPCERYPCLGHGDFVFAVASILETRSTKPQSNRPGTQPLEAQLALIYARIALHDFQYTIADCRSRSHRAHGDGGGG